MGVGGVGQRRGGTGTETDFAWDDGHIMQCTDVLLSCTFETCMIFVNQCHPNEFNFKKRSSPGWCGSVD